MNWRVGDSARWDAGHPGSRAELSSAGRNLLVFPAAQDYDAPCGCSPLCRPQSMFSRVFIFSGGVLLLLGSGNLPSASGELKVEIRLASNKLCVSDPLLAKVFLVNNSPEPVSLPDKISSYLETVHFEMRGPRDADFRHVSSTTRLAARGGTPRVEVLKPNSTMTSCEALYTSIAGLTFAEPGVYAIRVNVGFRTEVLAQSPTVEVTVSDRADKERIPSERASSFLRNHLDPITGAHQHEPEDYERAANEFGDSVAKSTLHWNGAIARLRMAGEQTEKDAARKAYDALWRDADPVTRDWMTLRLAFAYKQTKQYQAAIAELDAIKDANTQKAQLLSGISEIQREAFEARQRREKTPAD